MISVHLVYIFLFVCLLAYETAKLFCRVALQFHIPSCNVKEIKFLITHTRILDYHIFSLSSSSDGYVLKSHYSLNLYFSND